MTDGMPDEQMGRTDIIIDASKEMEREQKLPISLIQVGFNPKVNRFLKVTRLAQENWGEF